MDELSAKPSRRISWSTRLLAPLALLVVLIAGFVIVTGNLGADESTDPAPVAQQGGKGGGDGDGAENPRKYAVEPGDSLSSIAEKFDVSVKRLERLNPDVDSSSLAAGQEITIR